MNKDGIVIKEVQGSQGSFVNKCLVFQIGQYPFECLHLSQASQATQGQPFLFGSLAERQRRLQ